MDVFATTYGSLAVQEDEVGLFDALGSITESPTPMTSLDVFGLFYTTIQGK